MYDCIVQALGTLPAGVELIEVLEEAAEAEVAEVMAAMPRKGDQLSAQDMVAAGEAWVWLPTCPFCRLRVLTMEPVDNI